jgi:hypothetical protein
MDNKWFSTKERSGIGIAWTLIEFVKYIGDSRWNYMDNKWFLTKEGIEVGITWSSIEF